MTERKWYGVVVHHSAGPRYQTLEQIRAYHKRKGWKDVGYHFLFIRDRATDKLHLKAGRSTQYQGCHGDAHYNATCLGICVVGNYSIDHLTAEDYQDVLRGIAHVMDNYNIGRNKCYAHKDVKATACPGDNFPLRALKADLQTWRVT